MTDLPARVRGQVHLSFCKENLQRNPAPSPSHHSKLLWLWSHSRCYNHNTPALRRAPSPDPVAGILMLSVAEAQAVILQAARLLPAETVALVPAALGLVLAE